MTRTTGKYVTTTVAGEEVRAFIPHPLPPKNPALQVDATMAEALGAATASLARLALAGEMVPSVSWLVYAFVRKEAVLSSQIEGTQATLVDLFTLEAHEPRRSARRGPMWTRCATTWTRCPMPDRSCKRQRDCR